MAINLAQFGTNCAQFITFKTFGCDSWEDIFRDYNIKYLEDKADGVEIAINGVMEQIDREKQK